MGCSGSTTVCASFHFQDTLRKTHFYAIRREGDFYIGHAILPGEGRPIYLKLSADQLDGGKWAGQVKMFKEEAFKPQPWEMLRAKHFSPTESVAGSAVEPATA